MVLNAKKHFWMQDKCLKRKKKLKGQQLKQFFAHFLKKMISNLA